MKKKTTKLTRKGHTTAAEEVVSSAPLKVHVELNEQSRKRIDAMAFKQVQIGSRMDTLEGTMSRLASSILGMAGMVESELHRIKSRPAIDSDPCFYPKMFNKISIRLRKKSIDVVVEDIHEGSKRKRVFRCSDWTRVEHFMSYRSLTDGIEELAVKPTVRRLTAGKKTVAKKRAAKKTPADVRYDMERAGIENRVVAGKEGKTAYLDPEADKDQRAVNRSREKAEKVIVKLCSAGGSAEGAKDAELIEALQANGFDREVAFYAAMNCGRVTDPRVINQHKPKRNAKALGDSNPY